MQPNDLQWKIVKPPAELTDFVESFWMLANHSDKEHQMIILPDGRGDIIFSLWVKKYFSTLFTPYFIGRSLIKHP